MRSGDVSGRTKAGPEEASNDDVRMEDWEIDFDEGERR